MCVSCDTYRSFVNIKPNNLPEGLKVRDNKARPTIEVEQLSLHEAILEIALFGSSADLRRRADIINNAKSLKRLKEQLD